MKRHIQCLALVSVTVLIACERTWIMPDPYILIPTVQTSEVKYVTPYTATCGGVITSGGGKDGILTGVCWSTKPHPSIGVNTDSSSTTDSYSIYNIIDSITSPVNFECPIDGLTGNTTYYIRAFAQIMRKGSIGYYSSEEAAYGNDIKFTSNAEPPTVTDADGNVYHTIQIGTQLWMLENLRTTKYNDGTDIPTVKGDNGEAFNSLSPYYFDYWFNASQKWYNPFNKNTVGFLYNGYAVATGKLAPSGWHVPSIKDWIKLSDYLGGDSVSGGKLKSAFTSGSANHIGSPIRTWMTPNTGATNATGFSALPGGYYYNYGKDIILYDPTNPNTFGFQGTGYFGHWWSSTEAMQNSALYSIALSFQEASTYFTEGLLTQHSKQYGFSVRCVKD